jgi:hypothetical protein
MMEIPAEIQKQENRANSLKEEVKRVNYFNTQFLEEADFLDEQAYHIRLRRANNRAIHGWGIIEGLDIKLKDPVNKVVSVDPGIAIDNLGREIVIAEDSPIKSYDLSILPVGTAAVFLTIAYNNDTDEKDQNKSGDTSKFTRVTERPILKVSSVQPNNDGTVIVLGKVTLNAAGSLNIDLNSRQIARSQSSPIVGTQNDGQFVAAPDGNPANWVIFVSLHKIGQIGTIISELEIFATLTGNGWTITCAGKDATGNSLPGEANYLILRKLSN